MEGNLEEKQVLDTTFSSSSSLTSANSPSPPTIKEEYSYSNNSHRLLSSSLQHSEDLAEAELVKSEERASVTAANGALFEDIFSPPSIPRIKRGKMSKLATGIFKNWRERFFILDKGILAYYEPEHLYMQGQFDLTGYEIVENYPQDPPEMIRLQSHHRPDICLRTKIMKDREKWIIAIQEHVTFLQALNAQDLPRPSVIGEKTVRAQSGFVYKSTTRSVDHNGASPSAQPSPLPALNTINFTTVLPEPCQGWLEKKGQFFPSIRRRFFILSGGTLSYYAEDITQQLNNGTLRVPRPKGMIPLFGYELYSDTSEGHIELLLIPGPLSLTKRRLALYCDDFMVRALWVKAINAHAIYQPPELDTTSDSFFSRPSSIAQS
eukprot:gene10062-11133_t